MDDSVSVVSDVIFEYSLNTSRADDLQFQTVVIGFFVY